MKKDHKESQNGTKDVHPPLLLSRRGLAARYSVSKRLVDQWVDKGFLPVVKLSARCHRIHVPSADRLVLAHTDKKEVA